MAVFSWMQKHSGVTGRLTREAHNLRLFFAVVAFMVLLLTPLADAHHKIIDVVLVNSQVYEVLKGGIFEFECRYNDEAVFFGAFIEVDGYPDDFLTWTGSDVGVGQGCGGWLRPTVRLERYGEIGQDMVKKWRKITLRLHRDQGTGIPLYPHYSLCNMGEDTKVWHRGRAVPSCDITPVPALPAEAVVFGAMVDSS